MFLSTDERKGKHRSGRRNSLPFFLLQKSEKYGIIWIRNKEKRRKIMEKLTKDVLLGMKDNATISIVDVYELTTKLLNVVFGEGNYSLPIDVEAIANRLNIEIVEINLKDMHDWNAVNKTISEYSCRPRILSDGCERKIYVDSTSTLYLQRYAIAYQIGMFFIHRDRSLCSATYSAMPLLPKSREELIANAFALALLTPMGPFLQEMHDYITTEEKLDKLPIQTENWIQYISSSARIPFYYAACAYTQIMGVALALYQHRKNLLGDEYVKNVAKQDQEKYSELLCAVKDFLTDELIKKIFV